MAELQIAQAAEDAKKSTGLGETAQGDGSDTEAETVIESTGPGSKVVEVVDNPGEMKPRGSPFGSKSEISTEDEWEKVSEDEKTK